MKEHVLLQKFLVFGLVAAFTFAFQHISANILCEECPLTFHCEQDWATAYNHQWTKLYGNGWLEVFPNAEALSRLHCPFVLANVTNAIRVDFEALNTNWYKAKSLVCKGTTVV